MRVGLECVGLGYNNSCDGMMDIRDLSVFLYCQITTTILHFVIRCNERQYEVVLAEIKMNLLQREKSKLNF